MGGSIVAFVLVSVLGLVIVGVMGLVVALAVAATNSGDRTKEGKNPFVTSFPFAGTTQQNQEVFESLHQSRATTDALDSMMRDSWRRN